MQRGFLFSAVRRELRDLLNDYIPKLAMIEDFDKFIVPPKPGNHSGVLGAILLAKELHQKAGLDMSQSASI